MIRMNRFTKSIALSVASAALLSACSRPMATFQASKPVHYYTPSSSVMATETGKITPTTVAEIRSNQPIIAEPTSAELVPPALTSLKTTYTADKRMTRRMERIEKQLTENRVAPVAAKVQKTSLLQKVLLKKMARQMQHKLAPNQPQELSSTARLGLIIAGIGLVLLLIGNGLGSILGLLALLAGGALFVYALLQE